jgi:hypothetical protein
VHVIAEATNSRPVLLRGFMRVMPPQVMAGAGLCWRGPGVRLLWRDRDGTGIVADPDRLEGGVGGGVDRDHEAEQG